MTKEAWIDFTELGHPGYLPIAVQEMAMMLQCAQAMQQRHSALSCDTLQHILQQDLTQQALQHSIDDQWICRATLCLALRGLTGHAPPDIYITQQCDQ